MSRYRGPKAKICRRFGENLYGMDGIEKILSRRNYPAGMHGKTSVKSSSEYGQQFRNKQKVKFIFGLTETQFRKHYEDVKSKKGVIGDLFLARLEQRLDNVVYRLGFANTRSQARQIVSHNMIRVNGKKMNIPSYEVKVGDEISINPNKINNGYFKNQEQYILNKKNVSSWLLLDNQNKLGRVISIPSKENFDANINVQSIVSLYSK